jgi:hypothetical protein
LDGMIGVNDRLAHNLKVASSNLAPTVRPRLVTNWRVLQHASLAWHQRTSTCAIGTSASDPLADLMPSLGYPDAHDCDQKKWAKRASGESAACLPAN